MKIKQEYELAILKIRKEELENIKDILIGVDLSLTLSNYKSLSSNDNIRKAFNEISLLIREVDKCIKKENEKLSNTK